MLREVLRRAEFCNHTLISAHEVQRWPCGLIDRLVSIGILREAAASNCVFYDYCDEGGCWITPEWREYPKVGLRGVYVCKADGCGRIEVEPDLRRRWEFDLTSTGAWLARELSLDCSVQAVLPDRICLVGTMATANGPLDVFLARGMSWPDGGSIIQRADRLASAHAAVVMVVEGIPPSTIWPANKPIVLSLAEHFRFDCNGTNISADSLSRALRSVRPPMQEEIWLTVTEAAKLLLTDVSGLELAAAKARVSKAAKHGRFRTNGNSGHKRRIEVVSFSAWRLLQRERDIKAADTWSEDENFE